LVRNEYQRLLMKTRQKHKNKQPPILEQPRDARESLGHLVAADGDHAKSFEFPSSIPQSALKTIGRKGLRTGG